MTSWVLRLAWLLLLCAGATGARAAGPDFCTYGKAAAVLLVDRTTQFDATDKSVFLEALNGIVQDLGPGDRLAVYTMGAAYTESRKIFDRCKPGCPDEGFFNGLLSPCRPVLARSEYQGFIQDLARTLAELLGMPEDTRSSDLFRTVAEVTRATAADGTRGKPVRTLIVFSDLLENSSIMPEREFRRLSAADVLKKLASSGIAATLPGAAVRVFGFGRDDAPGRPPLPQDQRRRIADSWRSWLLAGGAVQAEIGFR